MISYQNKYWRYHNTEWRRRDNKSFPHDYGVYDETDYSHLRVVNGHYDLGDLDRAYIGNAHRYDLIFRYYRKYARRRAIGFCSSRKHAIDMARDFNARGIRAAAVISGEQGEFCMERSAALRRLRSCDLQVLFSVDMFNEGVDVPDIDLVMFLRPTESPVIFLQQLGRGLRRAHNKPYLNVLDFIGNYRKAGSAPQLLRGDGGRSRSVIAADRDDLHEIFRNKAFQRHYRDIIEYRTVDYYQRRYAAASADGSDLENSDSLGNQESGAGRAK